MAGVRGYRGPRRPSLQHRSTTRWQEGTAVPEHHPVNWCSAGRTPRAVLQAAGGLLVLRKQLGVLRDPGLAEGSSSLHLCFTTFSVEVRQVGGWLPVGLALHQHLLGAPQKMQVPRSCPDPRPAEPRVDLGIRAFLKAFQVV